MELKLINAEIINVSNQVTSKKGNTGSIITFLPEGGDKTEVVWDNNPNYETAKRSIQVYLEKAKDGNEYYKMAGNFLAKEEVLKIQFSSSAKQAFVIETKETEDFAGKA